MNRQPLHRSLGGNRGGPGLGGGPQMELFFFSPRRMTVFAALAMDPLLPVTSRVAGLDPDGMAVDYR